MRIIPEAIAVIIHEVALEAAGRLHLQIFRRVSVVDGKAWCLAGAISLHAGEGGSENVGHWAISSVPALDRIHVFEAVFGAGAVHVFGWIGKFVKIVELGDGRGFVRGGVQVRRPGAAGIRLAVINPAYRVAL